MDIENIMPSKINHVKKDNHVISLMWEYKTERNEQEKQTKTHRYNNSVVAAKGKGVLWGR